MEKDMNPKTITVNTTESIIQNYLDRKQALAFFDVNMWVGPSLEKTFKDNNNFDALKIIANQN